MKMKLWWELSSRICWYSYIIEWSDQCNAFRRECRLVRMNKCSKKTYDCTWFIYEIIIFKSALLKTGLGQMPVTRSLLRKPSFQLIVPWRTYSVFPRKIGTASPKAVISQGGLYYLQRVKEIVAISKGQHSSSYLSSQGSEEECRFSSVRKRSQYPRSLCSWYQISKSGQISIYPT